MPKKSDTKNTAKNKPEKFQAPRGLHDVLPDDHAYFTVIKKVVRHRARQAGFRRISTPTFELKNLFTRGVGEQTDIVEKELYTFATKKGGDEYALRPEGTAGIVRAYIQHGMNQLPQPVELFYIEPFFRHDRPQKGRYRQFHQFGFEVVGEPDPGIDAQIIQLAVMIHEDLGIANKLKLQINTIGCPKCREKFVSQLRDYFIGKERSLCANCVKRLDENPLRILDCKKEDCQILAENAPKFENVICEECKDHHKKVLELLDAIDIKYTENPQLVRGLDYYSRTVFEFWTEEEGAQNSVGGGGRYDDLVEQLGGSPTAACGYAGGVERLIELMKVERMLAPDKDKIDVFVAQLGFEAKKFALQILTELREEGVHALGALGKSSMKDQLGKADKFGVKYALILGEVEVREGKIILRDMKSGVQEVIPIGKAVEKVIKKIGAKNLDKYDPTGELKKDTTVRPEEELLIRD
ncbi:MAG: histidine--tRNA ligase [Candidatus Peribacteraceae bacterium]|nr:histidine--tRNA ligase [Candidatus Peribacteraceae bacterium]